VLSKTGLDFFAPIPERLSRRWRH